MSMPFGCGPTVRRNGFTLLEILVALVVLGFLMVGLSQGVRFGLRAWDTETRLVATRSDLDGVERVLRAVLESADPGEFNEPPNFKGDAHKLLFNGRMPTPLPGLPVRDAELGLGVDLRHRLVLRWVPRPHAQRLTKDLVPVDSLLLEGVDHIELKYRRWPSQGGGWVTEWTQPTLPVQVSLKIEFLKDDRRHWPTLIVALMRARIEE
jgi:general secretion pathway protein J